MSHTEHHIGKLRKVEINEGYSVEDWCREKCQEAGIPTIPEYYDSWQETLKNVYETYFFVNDAVWEVFDHTEFEDDIYKMVPNADGTISFIMSFYNGGTCLSECIEEGLLKYKQFNH
jgi:hypothetical protein